MKKCRKKSWFLLITILCNALVLVYSPSIGKETLFFCSRNFGHFLFELTPVFICVGLMDVWIERDKMTRIMGERSGLKGCLTALLWGMMTAVPLYALLPVAGLLLKKGSRISNVLLFLCSSAGIRIPLLLFEASSLGLRFTLIRFCLNLPVIFAIAFLVERLLSEEEKKKLYHS